MFNCFKIQKCHLFHSKEVLFSKLFWYRRSFLYKNRICTSPSWTYSLVKVHNLRSKQWNFQSNTIIIPLQLLFYFISVTRHCLTTFFKVSYVEIIENSQDFPAFPSKYGIKLIQNCSREVNCKSILYRSSCRIIITNDLYLDLNQDKYTHLLELAGEFVCFDDLYKH